MKLNNIAKFFTPSNKVFFTLFEDVADRLQKMGEHIKVFANEPNASVRLSMFQEMEQFEHDNDKVTHTVYTELGHTFITPFDREDIHTLIGVLEDVADFIHSAEKRMVFYHFNPNETFIIKFVNMISDVCKEIKEAVYCLRELNVNTHRLSEAVIRINSIENQADDVFDVLIEQLFSHEENIKEFIKKKEILQVLEDTIDQCEDVANTISGIAIKYT